MNTRNIVKNIRSAAVIDGKPKLPTSGQLSEGEIAVNYAKGYETLSFKNNSNEIVSLSVKTVDDVTVNGNSVVSNKTANITMKGSTTPVADTYTTTTYPSPFNEGAEHISASDKVNVALKKVETNISKLVSEVVHNENVASEAISKLANSAGTIDGSNNITYVKATNAHYIKNATSVHDATVKLDSNVYSIKRAVDDIGNAVDGINSHVTTIESSVSNLGNEVITIKGDVNALKGDVKALKGRVNTIENNVNTIENNVTSIGGKVTYLENNVTTIESSVSNLGTNYGKLNGTVGSLESIINSLQTTVNSLQSTVNSLQMEYVDLGLPSGRLWAKCNLGAVTETDYGDYFMWGSTTPDNNHTCNWANTPFNNGTSKYDGTYFNSVKDTLCPGNVLAKEFDAAYKATNGMGRMPTVDDWEELRTKTTNKWVTNYNGTGVNGWKFTGSNSNSIFIPAAGRRSNSSFGEQGNYGYIWSSTSAEADFANNTYFSFHEGLNPYDTSERSIGFSIRPIKDLI